MGDGEVVLVSKWQRLILSSRRLRSGLIALIPDIVVLFLAPTIFMSVLFAVHYPTPRMAFEYAPADPTLFTVYGMHFAHSDMGHLVKNLGTLWLIGGLGFLLVCACGRKRLYYYAFAAFLIVYPVAFAPVLHASVLYFRPEQYPTVASVGSSGIISALVAFLAVATTLYVRDCVVSSVSLIPFASVVLLSGFVTPAFVRGWSMEIRVAATLSAIGSLGYGGWYLYYNWDRVTVSVPKVNAVLWGIGSFHIWAYWMLSHKEPGIGFDVHLMGYIGGVVLTIGIVGLTARARASAPDHTTSGCSASPWADRAVFGVVGLSLALVAARVVPAVGSLL